MNNDTRRRFLKKFGLAAAGLGIVSTGRAATAKRQLPPADLDFLSARMPLLRRQEWTERAVRPWRLRTASVFDRITVHHAGDVSLTVTDKNSVIYRLDGILTGHMDRNYGDIGYHFIVDYAGRAWEGRSLAYEGAHVLRQNDGNIGIMLLGNFQQQQPSAQQVDACARLIGLLRAEHRIKRHRIYGHRDLGQSLCPGQYLYRHVAQWRDA